MCKSFLALCIIGVSSGVLAHPYQVPNEQPAGYGAVDFVHASLDSLPDFAKGVLYVPETTSATFQLAAKEYDPPLSKIVSVYDHTQNKANGFLQAKPIVDNIKEEDKYGNTGDQHATVGRFIVNGFEGISNLINKLFEAPVTGQRLIGRKVTDQLNKVGAKLVGL